jgi:predicted membrane-bound spermidine synthase
LFIRTQGALSAYPLLLPVILWSLSGRAGILAAVFGSNAVFPLLSIAAGFIGGFQFPLAAGIYMAEKDKTGQAAGLIYGIDLAGSCAGALVTGTFFIPILGIPNTCLAFAAINAATLIVAMIFGMTK